MGFDDFGGSMSPNVQAEKTPEVLLDIDYFENKLAHTLESTDRDRLSRIITLLKEAKAGKEEKDPSDVQLRVLDVGLLSQVAIGMIEQSLFDAGNHHAPGSWIEETYDNQLNHADEHLDHVFDETQGDEDNLAHTVCRLTMARVKAILSGKCTRTTAWEKALVGSYLARIKVKVDSVTSYRLVLPQQVIVASG